MSSLLLIREVDGLKKLFILSFTETMGTAQERGAMFGRRGRKRQIVLKWWMSIRYWEQRSEEKKRTGSY